MAVMLFFYTKIFLWQECEIFRELFGNNVVTIEYCLYSGWGIQDRPNHSIPTLQKWSGWVEPMLIMG